jgi:hypothetical protein
VELTGIFAFHALPRLRQRETKVLRDDDNQAATHELVDDDQQAKLSFTLGPLHEIVDVKQRPQRGFRYLAQCADYHPSAGSPG